MNIHLDMYQTLAVALLVLMLGSFLRKKIHFLEKFCIPAPVIGGLLFAIFTCVCYSTGVAEFFFDDTLREVCMVFFFTSVGFQANLKVLKSGGKSMAVFLGLVITLIISQNFLAVGLSKLLGLNPLIGMCTGSIPMVGGHGTAGAFGPVLEDFNIHGATTICTAAATFGLIAGSLIGGPLGKRLVEKKNLLPFVKEFYEDAASNDEGFKSIYCIRVLFSLHWPFWILIVCIACVLLGRQYRLFLALMPSIGLWGTYLLGPLCNYRYIYPLVILYPLYFGLARYSLGNVRK